MRKLLKRIEAALAAVAFAEEGEFETARDVLAEGEREATPQRPARGGGAERPARSADAERRDAPRRRRFHRQRIARIP